MNEKEGIWEKGKRFCAKNRVAVIAGAAVLLAAVALLILLTTGGQPQSPVGDWRRADENAAGLAELHLRDDRSGEVVIRDAFDPEPRRLAAAWQTQDDALLIVAEGQQAMTFSVQYSGGRMELKNTAVPKAAPVVFQRIESSTQGD